MEALLAVTSVYEAMKNKPSYIERRAMNEKLKPWEAVRQIQEVFQSLEAEVEARLQHDEGDTQDEQKQMAQAEAVRSMLREKVRDLVIFMKHQIHMSLKLKPGKQDYADFETRKGRHERNLGRLTGGGTSLRTRGSLRGG